MPNVTPLESAFCKHARIKNLTSSFVRNSAGIFEHCRVCAESSKYEEILEEQVGVFRAHSAASMQLNMQPDSHIAPAIAVQAKSWFELALAAAKSPHAVQPRTKSS